MNSQHYRFLGSDGHFGPTKTVSPFLKTGKETFINQQVSYALPDFTEIY